jgi:hypothetical protein
MEIQFVTAIRGIILFTAGSGRGHRPLFFMPIKGKNPAGNPANTLRRRYNYHD